MALLVNRKLQQSFLVGFGTQTGGCWVQQDPIPKDCILGVNNHHHVSTRSIVSSSLLTRKLPLMTTASINTTSSSNIRSAASFSSLDGGGGGGAGMMMSQKQQQLRAYPSYTVFGETCFLTIKVLMPVFKILRSNSLVVDGNRRGKIIFEWTPKMSDGTFHREGQIRFALNPEEVGFMIDQLPENEVVLSRKLASYIDSHVDRDAQPTKVLRILPGPGSTLIFRVDFEKDGQGGQPQYEQDGDSSSSTVVTGPLETKVQVGEYQVIKSILSTTLPALVGWSTKLEIALNYAVRGAPLDGPHTFDNSSGGAPGRGFYS